MLGIAMQSPEDLWELWPKVLAPEKQPGATGPQYAEQLLVQRSGQSASEGSVGQGRSEGLRDAS